MQFDLLNYRRSNPVTSREAGDHARQFRSGDEAAILGALDHPMACEEISDALGWNNHVRANRRMAALERAGLIIRTEERHVNRSRRQAFKYRAK